jgi:hypothetical protein
MSARAPRRLPGFRFENQAPTLPEVLPRMDIAVFVGFAASGPLQTPVVIETEQQFAAIFGEDAPLAWDVDRGEQIYAYLAPAVRAFFRNGGRRCWIIRVARQATREVESLNRARNNFFPVPCLARAEFNSNGSLRTITPAFAQARSEGSWSDPIRVSSALLSRPQQINGGLIANGSDYEFQIVRDQSHVVAAGDLLRFDFESEGVFAFMALKEVVASQLSDPVTLSPFQNVTANRAVWLQSLAKDPGAPTPDTAVKAAVFTRELLTSPPNPEQGIAAFEVEFDAVLSPGQLTLLQDHQVSVKLLNCPLADAPLPGSLVRIELGNTNWWLTVERLDFTSGDEDGVPLVWGQAFRVIDVPNPLPTAAPACERLSFELWVRKAEEYAISLSDLGFAEEHERYWAKLPGDEELYRDFDSVTREEPATVLWRQVGDLFRFPLAGVPTAGEVYFPLMMPAFLKEYLGPVELPGSERERDGLAEFDADLFLDGDLLDIGAGTLASTADFLQYTSPRPRRLTGVHAAFPLEEATIIAVPDAVHHGWDQQSREPLSDPPPSLPPLRPEWWHFLDCNPSTEAQPPLSDCEAKEPTPSPIKPVHEPEWGNFLNCAINIIDPPQLVALPNLSRDGNFTLTWESSPPIAAEYVLEEATNSDFTNSEVIHSGEETSFTLYGRRTGDYFYRVRSVVGPDTSDWSNGVAVRVEESSLSLLNKDEYSADVLLAVQRSLLRMSAARGDLFSVLSLPEHYREDEAIEHTNLLKAPADLAPPTQGVSALSRGEANAFTYGAVYHPWLIGRENQEDAPIRMPPCGAVIGSIAESALTRGAWIAPANRPLRGVMALQPNILSERRLEIQDARINLVRQEPRGFLVLDADTLSDDEDLRPTNVRRLLILLRRQALRLGATYVFEPNSSAFRRAVDRGFTEMLDGMFERGAFAGATPATSYQVVTDDSLNTSQSIDLGRFIVELRVAPSLPLTFLTIRLVQTSDRTLATEVI